VKKANNKLLILVVLLPIVLVIIATVILMLSRQTTEPQTTITTNTPAPNSDGVSIYNPPRDVQDFAMPATTGETLNLSDLRGKLVLIAFGYTRCPDVCPVNMTDFRQVKRFLGENADDVVFILISVDGERDTPDLLRDYLLRYDPDFIGLSGIDETLIPIQEDYGLYYGRIENPRAPNDYMVDHTASRFLVDREGRLSRVYSFTTNPRAMARDIIGLLSQ
jgi:protein SCO1/2